MEVIIVMLLIGVLAVAISSRWPTGMDDKAAVLEFKRAVRYAQHKAMTRQYTGAATAWKIGIAANHYTIQREGTDCSTCPIDPGCAEPDYCDRALLDHAAISLVGPTVWFNGLGEPTDMAGNPLAASTFTISGGNTVTICPETGYVQEGPSCP